MGHEIDRNDVDDSENARLYQFSTFCLENTVQSLHMNKAVKNYTLHAWIRLGGSAYITGRDVCGRSKFVGSLIQK